MALDRIDKILSSQNIAARSEIKRMIRSGLILADGKRVMRPEENTTPKRPYSRSAARQLNSAASYT